MIEGEELCDCSSHRYTKDMGALDIEGVHDSDNIIGHICKGVSALNLIAPNGRGDNGFTI